MCRLIGFQFFIRQHSCALIRTRKHHRTPLVITLLLRLPSFALTPPFLCGAQSLFHCASDLFSFITAHSASSLDSSHSFSCTSTFCEHILWEVLAAEEHFHFDIHSALLIITTIRPPNTHYDPDIKLHSPSLFQPHSCLANSVFTTTKATPTQG
jgi:hypothetical protein